MAAALWRHCITQWTTRAFNPAAPEFKTIFWPSIAYWSACVFYDVLDHMSLPAIARHRIKRVDPGRSNSVTRSHVIIRVLLLHGLQVVMGLFLTAVDPAMCVDKPDHAWQNVVAQFILGMLVMDTWQFWIHRWMHVNPKLYKLYHATHHMLLIPYSYGALYNHPVESFMLDTLGAVVTMYATRMDCSVSAPFFAFASIKTVLDHSGYRFPVNPLHSLFPNSAAYHDVHHHLKHIKSNFSQPFFTHWDVIMGSWVHPDEIHFHVPRDQIKGASVAPGMVVDRRAGDDEVDEGKQAPAAAAAASKVASPAAPPAAEAQTNGIASEDSVGPADQDVGKVRRRLKA